MAYLCVEPDCVDESTLSEVATTLQQLDRRSGWARTCDIGALIIDKFFEGNAQAWRDRSGRREQSLRRLAAHPNCPLRKSALAETINVFLFVQTHPSVRELEHVAPAHVARVLRLEPDAALHWLKTTDEERLSVKSLAERLRSVAVRRTKSQARAAAEAVVALQRLEQRLKLLAERVSEPSVWLSVDEEAILQLIESIREQLDAISSAGRAAEPRVAHKSSYIQELAPPPASVRSR